MIRRNFSATRILASLVGVYCGLLRMEHGYFETLQGNVAPSSIFSSFPSWSLVTRIGLSKAGSTTVAHVRRVGSPTPFHVG